MVINFRLIIIYYLELSHVLEAFCITSAKSDLEMNLAMNMLGLADASFKKVDDRHFLLIFPDSIKGNFLLKCFCTAIERMFFKMSFN